LARSASRTGGRSVSGHGEDHRDRPHLRDHDDAVLVAAPHHVAGVHLAQTETAVDGRDDPRVGQVEAGARDLRSADWMAPFNCRTCAPGRHLLRRDQLFLLQLLVALEIGLGVAQPGLALFERTLRLRQLHLIGPVSISPSTWPW
jgi:hypothetical protein